MTKDEILACIKSFPFWYHKIQLGDEIATPGWAPIAPASYRIPEDLTGKRILDVGAWDGYWSFEAMRRGATEVVAIDDFSDNLGHLGDHARQAWDTFDFCRSVLGYDHKRCRRIDMSVYDVTPELLGKFDVVFFFGTFYHLRHPLLALDRLSSVCTEKIFIESAILDDYSPYQGGLNHGYGQGQMLMEFYPDKEYGGNSTNWWVPTLNCLANMTLAAGFDSVVSWKLVDSPDRPALCRGHVFGEKA